MLRRSILTYVLLIIVGNALGFLGCQLRLRLHRNFADCVAVPKAVRMTESVDTPASIPAPIPIGTTYCTCSNCKTAYLLDGKALNFRGNKVRCEVCNKEWFQTTDRLFRTDDTNELLPMPKETVQDVKRILAEGNALRYSRVDKVGVFIGNLPYSYTEKEIEELLAEYGVINVSLVRDADQQSKGFAFVDVSTAINGTQDTVTAVALNVVQISSKEDAERLLSEMANYYTEPGRKLTVRMVKAVQYVHIDLVHAAFC